ncbi:MAG: hypothetical protein D6683_02765, partial [Actinomyces sp.]
APAEPEPEPAAPPPPFVEAARRRHRIPVWVVPVLLFLPFWAVFYVGTLERPPEQAVGLLARGEEVFANNCAACHGADGGGGSGPQLNGGEVLLTFPDAASHVAWVLNGSPAANGTPYGDPNRPGGQHVSRGGMPSWASLGTEDVLAAVHYERVRHGGLDEAAAAEELATFEAVIDSGTELGAGMTPADVDAVLSSAG